MWRHTEFNNYQGSPYKWTKGGGKKGGKGKSKQKGKGNSEHSLVSFTDDNKQICFAYNAQGCTGGCNRVHVCRVRGCGKAHPMWQHYQGMMQKGAGDASTGNKKLTNGGPAADVEGCVPVCRRIKAR